MSRLPIALICLLFSVVCAGPARAAAILDEPYSIGTPTLSDLWVDPLNGDDSRTGATRIQALRTIAEAYQRIPQGVPLTVGYRIRLVAGSYPAGNIPNYWEQRYGTAQHPVILEAADGAGTAVVATLNVFDSRYFYLIGLHTYGELHFEQCDHILLRQLTLRSADAGAWPQEGLKVNQSQYFYIEDSDLAEATDNVIDFVAVQYGHVRTSRIHDAGDWCQYAKGGSAYLVISGNEYYNCGTGGFTAGQGTGFEFMGTPWLHYEAYDIKFINNLIHDVEGAAFGVNGGYNILMAGNTAYRFGTRSHLFEAVFGARSCDGDTATCGAHIAAGGWGTAVVGVTEPIPNRNIYVYDNIFYNPAGVQSAWQHIAVYGHQAPGAASNIPDPAESDRNLRFRGNLIWNGPADHPLGIEEGASGCNAGNPTCNTAQLLADNTINVVEPQLVDPAHGDYRPVVHSNLFAVDSFIPSDFDWSGLPAAPAGIPAGQAANEARLDRDGAVRTASSAVGAYAWGRVDGDGDAIPDSWEVVHGLNPASGADAALDGDGDAATNLVEHRQGTEPGRADSDGDGIYDGGDLTPLDAGGCGDGAVSLIIGGIDIAGTFDCTADAGISSGGVLRVLSGGRARLHAPRILLRAGFQVQSGGWLEARSGS